MGELSGNIKEFFWQLDELKQAFYHQREILAKIEIIFFKIFIKILRLKIVLTKLRMHDKTSVSRQTKRFSELQRQPA